MTIPIGIVRSQYTVWCWVLIDSASPPSAGRLNIASQYTVWCWVLIDSHLYKPHHNAAYSTVVATGDSRTPTRQ